MSAFVLGFQYLQLRINGTEIEVFLRATGGEHPHLIHFIVASDGLYDNQIQQLKLPRDERNTLICLHGNILLVSIRSGRIVVRDTGPLRPSYSILVTFTLIRPVLNGQIVVLFFCSIHHDLVTSSSYLWAFCPIFFRSSLNSHYASYAFAVLDSVLSDYALCLSEKG